MMGNFIDPAVTCPVPIKGTLYPYLLSFKFFCMNPHVETPYIRLELLPNGILIATYKRRTLITLDIAEEIVRTRLAFAGHEPRPVLIFDQGVKVLDKAALKFIASDAALEGIKASAIVATKLSTHMIMIVVLAIKRQKIPAKVYRSEKGAMNWLEKYV